MEGASDRDLIRRYLAGEARAFDDLVARYERKVHAVALRMCGDPEDARDVTQEVFVSALRSIRGFREEAQLGTWFHRIAVNASLDHLRRRRKHAPRPIEEVGERPSHDPGPDELAIGASRAAEVHRALARLSEEHRAVLVLHDLQGLDYAEVAEALDIPVGTVKSRIHRGRCEIARMLGHLREGEPAAGPGPLKER